jgi:hypothetical protein
MQSTCGKYFLSSDIRGVNIELDVALLSMKLPSYTAIFSATEKAQQQG